MKLNIIVIDPDVEFTSRFARYFAKHFERTFEVAVFRSVDEMQLKPQPFRPHLILVAPTIDATTPYLTNLAPVRYFVDSPEIEKVNEVEAIVKYQNMDVLQAKLTQICFDLIGHIETKQQFSSSTMVTCFTSPAGGVGTSTAAIAYSTQSANEGKRVLYFCIKALESSDVFFDKSGATCSLSDIVYMIKMQKKNLQIGVASCIVKDLRTGVSYIPSPRNAADVLELNQQERAQLIDTVLNLEGFDEIVIDSTPPLDKSSSELVASASNVIFVSDGSQIANAKIARITKVIESVEEFAPLIHQHRIGILYNKVTKHSEKLHSNLYFEFGVIPSLREKREELTPSIVIETIARGDYFETQFEEINND